MKRGRARGRKTATSATVHQPHLHAEVARVHLYSSLTVDYWLPLILCHNYYWLVEWIHVLVWYRVIGGHN